MKKIHISVLFIYTSLIIYNCKNKNDTQNETIFTAETLNTQTLEKKITKHSKNPFLVFFGNKECKVCDFYKPIFQDILTSATQKMPELKLYYVSCGTVESEEVCNRFSVSR